MLTQSAKNRQKLVRNDDGDADRHQRLAQLLTLHPTKKDNLQHDAKNRRCGHAHDQSYDPGLCISVIVKRIENSDASVSTDNKQRSVRHVHRAHQAEDQRESDRHNEVESGDGKTLERHR